jgi:hypothetical protein
MAAKKKARSTNKVTVTLDRETLEKFLDASRALSDLALAVAKAADEPTVRKGLIKRAKKGSRKRR